MATAVAPEYRGDIDEPMSSKEFLRKAELYMKMLYKQEEMADSVGLLFKDGSRAEEWYESKKEWDKKTWAEFKKEFLNKFLPRPAALKEKTEYRKQMLEMKLTIGELGKRDDSTGEWAHKRFARRLYELAKAAGIAETSSDIMTVHSGLPEMIKEKVLEEAQDWKKFTDEIAVVDKKHIETEKKKEEQIQALELKQHRLRHKPNEIRQHMAELATQIHSQRHRGHSNFAAYPGRATTAILNEAQKVTLRSNINAYNQRPNNTEGVEAYKKDMRELGEKWGRTKFNENMVYPYAPGTKKPGSGECFKCGKEYHGRGAPCNSGTAISSQEGHWRAFVQRELGRAGAGESVRVNMVGEEKSYDWMLAGFNPGNGEGSAE
ncbi:hypothetical protein VKT23_010577 [Stygiomarasmius scandens]|uniref:Polyprotein n=1 Tax=Marasmiellus scandens TaxID=2682957 RepID=A0ABR1JAN7_9AGAR